MDIPVFHDDQHGTAIIAACRTDQRAAISPTASIRDVPGWCATAPERRRIACIELIKSHGHAGRAHLSCATPRASIYKGRRRGHEPVEVGPRQPRARHARWNRRSRAPTCSSACRSRARSPRTWCKLDGRRTRSSSPMANPDPEISPEEAVAHVRDGRHHGDRAFRLSQPGQQRSRLSLISFAAPSTSAPRTINDADENRRGATPWPSWRAPTCRTRSPPPITAHQAQASGRDYVIPVPFDPRLITEVPAAVAKAAMESGRRAAAPIHRSWTAYQGPAVAPGATPSPASLATDLRDRVKRTAKARRFRRRRGAAA